MPPGLRTILSRLGISGSVCSIGALLVLYFLLTGQELAALGICLLLSPFAFLLAFRAFRSAKQRTLWSLRNRLLFVYGLCGILPLLLILTLVGLGAWAFVDEMAVYLASSALERHMDGLQAAVDAIHRQPIPQRHNAGPELIKAFDRFLPGVRIYVQDENGKQHFPATAPDLAVPAGWKTVHGLLVMNNRFYGWAHLVSPDGEFTAVAPLTDESIQSLVPHLGQIALFESHERKKGRTPASAGSLQVVNTGDSPNDPDYSVRQRPVTPTTLPPAMSRLDIPVVIASTQSHYHLESPNQSFSGVLYVHSRPSAVLSSFFTGSEVIREVLVDGFITIAVLFLLVELGALWVGISLSTRITAAVNELYGGTRRVTKGDFSHRIPVRDHDQLGELSDSFNQMTGNLQRLLEVEKEKERLQTEVEIAREVQSQLYPKAAPPTCGLKLTVRCDPARMVSGDYYDYLQIASGKLIFAIGDVAGKGISAALLMATLQAALRAQVTSYAPRRENDCTEEPEVDAATLVSKLNKQIHAHTAPEKYATFFFAIFDEVSCSLTYTNAGHLSPLLFRKDEVIPLDNNGTVVGAFPFAKFDESCLKMQPDDLLVCYTDGITEPENAYGEMFGEERLIELVHQHWKQDDAQIIENILDSVRRWTGVPELHDDMTLLLARHVGTPA